MTELLARLKPYDPKRNHTMRVFVLGSLRFDAGVRVEVDVRVADTLRAVHQSYYDPFSPDAFDIRAKPADENESDTLVPDETSQGEVGHDASAPRKPSRKARA